MAELSQIPLSPIRVGFLLFPNVTQPPFDSGSPERAAPETVAGYRKLVARTAPDRDARRQAVAARLGLER